MSLQYIIDGYNIIHHAIFIKQADRKTEDKRLSLLRLIKAKGLCGSAKNKIAIVFDGYPPPQDNQDLSNIPGIDIIFSRNISADEKIKIMVEKSADRRNIAVVSDDKEIKFIVKSLGAQHMGIEDFIAPKSNYRVQQQEQALKPELTYVQMQKINEELRKRWLES